MIRVVLDTNVLVSAGITAGGDCDRIIQAVLGGQIEITVSPGIVDEYLEVLHRSKFTRYRFPPVWVCRLLELAEHVDSDPVDMPSLEDQDDRVFLAVAQETGLLVTGNLKHFPRNAWGKARVLSPASFIKEHMGSDPE